MTLELAGDALLGVLVAGALLGALPLVVAVYQHLLVGLHAWRNHYGHAAEHLPRTVVLVPAWNEAVVLGPTIDQLMALDYPRDRLRVYVVDDASTDETPAVLAAKAEQYPGVVHHLRREDGGQGKAHTLNHGLGVALADDWMEALLVMDADVAYEPRSLRALTRHLADPEVGAVTAYIKEGSRPGTAVTRFVAHEYVAAQACARRAQDVLGAMACLAGGAQLHSRANLEALGGRIDTTTLAEDTVTTLKTQLGGRRVVFEPYAVAWAEEPETVAALWRQRLRWARGNVAVTRMFRTVWFRRSVGPLGGVGFGLLWFTTLLLPVFMLVSSASLVALFVVDPQRSQDAFRLLWVLSGLSFVFVTTSTLLIDLPTARRTWRQAILFPGLVSLLFIVAALLPAPFTWAVDEAEGASGVRLSDRGVELLMLAAYIWVSACMLGGWLVTRLDRLGAHRLARALLYVVGFGPVLCAVTFTAYVHEARGRELRWEKTVKTGRVAVRA
jgi:cellulose synthase/poly-beta-1,6-N-acetylglucosamine synthase-like glycosyltransferase